MLVDEDHGGHASHFLNRLVAAESELGRQLHSWRRKPLREYLRAVIPQPVQSNPNAHHRRLAEALERYLSQRGGDRVDQVCEGLLRIPVIQQADHSNLLLDPETFLNNFLFHIACREAGAPIALSSQCSTVSCLWKRQPLSGPVFLRSRGTVFRVFPLSRRRFKLSTFCCLPPLAMSFDGLDGECSRAPDDPVLGPLIDRQAKHAPSAYRECNELIWRRLDVDHDIRRVAVDEALASECLAMHLEDPASPVFHLLFEPRVRDCFVAVKRELVAERDNLAVNHATPDFFWLRDGSRLRKVVLAGSGPKARFVTASDNRPLPVPYEPAAIATALRGGVLYCDRVTAYTVRCLLPGVVAVGGTSQQDYVKLYRRALLETHRRVPFLTQVEAERIDSPSLSRLGGMPLIELDAEAEELLQQLGPSTRLETLERRYLGRPLSVTIGALRCAEYLLPALDRFEAPV